MKKTILTVSAVILCSTLAFNASARSAKMKLAHAMPLDHPVHNSLVWFAEQVSERTDVNVKVYPTAMLGGEEGTLQMLQSGTLAFTKVGSGLIASFSKQYSIFSLPYLYKDVEAYEKVINGPIGLGILESSENDGFIGLAALSSGARGFYSNHKIQKASDLKGLKIRVMNSPIDIDTMNTLGGSAVPISSTEVYSALQQGVVDGAENNIPTYFANRHYEVAKYYTLDHHTMTPDILAVSTEVWKKISPKDRNTIKTISVELQGVHKQFWDAYVEEAKGKIIQAGGEIVEADIASFQDKVKPVYAKFLKDNPELTDLLTKIQNN